MDLLHPNLHLVSEGKRVYQSNNKIMNISLLKQWSTWTIIITFIVGGLGSMTGLVSANTSGIITTVVTILGFVLHQNQTASAVAKG